jgi:hypothetical protein
MSFLTRRSLQVGASSATIFCLVVLGLRTLADHEPVFSRPQIYYLVGGSVGLFALIILWILPSFKPKD